MNTVTCRPSAPAAVASPGGATVRLLHGMIRLAGQLLEEHIAEHPCYCRCKWCKHADAVVGPDRQQREMVRVLTMLDTAGCTLGDLIEEHELDLTSDSYEGELRALAEFCEISPEGDR